LPACSWWRIDVRDSYTFDSDGTESISGVAYQRIRFKAHCRGIFTGNSPLRGKNYPLPLSGSLWIDPQSGAVVKLGGQVDSGLSDVDWPVCTVKSILHFISSTIRRRRSGPGIGHHRCQDSAPALAQPPRFTL